MLYANISRSVVLAVFSVLLFSSPLKAQKPYQLLLIGFDYHDHAVYFCNGQRLNEINTKVVGYNLYEETDRDFVVDSIRSVQSSVQFVSDANRESFQLAQTSLMPGPYYAPVNLGIDTVHITGYYGPYTSTARIICHARQLVSPLLYGYSRTRYAYGGNAVILTNYVLRDTLLDYLRLAPFKVTTIPQETGHNKAIVIRSCAGTRVDSVKLESDFSEFTFHNLPEPGQSISDSFAITYDFIPSIVGDHLRPISFKLSDGRWLTWIFEYRVRPASAVSGGKDVPKEVTLVMTGDREVSVTSRVEVSRLDVVDITGITRSRFYFDSQHKFRLELESLTPGVYFIQSPSFQHPAKLVLH